MLQELFDKYQNKEIDIFAIPKDLQKDFTQRLARAYEMEISLQKRVEKENALLLSTEQMRYFGAMVLKKETQFLTIGLISPIQKSHKDTLKRIFSQYKIHFELMFLSDFLRLLPWLEVEEQIKVLLQKIQNELDSKNSQNSSLMELLRVILQEALLKNASDIHFEKDENCVVRMRLDGVLLERFSLPAWIFNPLVLCLKLLAKLDITESTFPQDGRFSFELQEKKSEEKKSQESKSQEKILDFRISTLPLLESESVVLRILDREKTIMPLEGLGFQKEHLEVLTKLYNLPYGLVFITGPTGSGKSTTLYGILNKIKEKNLKIITLEDPVEYKISKISQAQMSKKMSFANALRSVLRQDPDVIMVGEIRDKETLQIAIQAAFTGHLVFSTLHTNDALDTIVRLLDMGIEPYFIAQSLSGIIAQRLLRKLCAHCKKEENGKIIACGCEACNFSGYAGREAIAEVLEMDGDLEDFIYKKITKEQAIMRLEQKNPNFSLQKQALLRVKKGLSDFSEMQRVVR